ncbi:kinase-like protein [Xylaria sp. FL0064]|nr:kinase-like protein [Xylaria sp. FL0064]
MAPVTNQMLNAQREKECVGLTNERKYFRVDGAWIKRSLRPSEWQTNPFAGTLFIPRFGNERILNEAATIRLIAEKTDIPVPKLYGCFGDDGAAYLVMEYIEGVTMNKLAADQRTTLRSLKSAAWGGPSGIVIPPYRLMVSSARPEWKMKPRESEGLRLLPQRLIKAIIDWEYAGFFPPEFEGMYFRRLGPSVTLKGEVNDEQHLLEIIGVTPE